MSGEYIIEIESFSSIKETKEYAHTHIKRGNKQVNIVSRDISVIELEELKK